MVTVTGLLFGLYYVLSANGVLTSGITTAEEVREMTDKVEADILAGISRIDALDFDDSVLELPEFKALVDTTIDLKEPEPVTRVNPFERY